MISILIPNYGQDIKKLIEDLLFQAKRVSFPVEIWIGDDASKENVYLENKKLEDHPIVRFIRKESRVGRSAIRNLLAEKSRYPNLLFIDSDAKIKDSGFLQNYFDQLGKYKVIVGGTAYQKDTPENSSELLRWKYGKEKEEKPAFVRASRPWASFSSFSFLIEKKLFLKIRFDEGIIDYGHEDTFFGYQLKKNSIPVLHIDNQLIHLGLDNAAHFIEKTCKGVEGLWNLFEKTGFDPEFSSDNTLLKRFEGVRKLKMQGILKWKFDMFKKQLEKNLLGEQPSILLYQLYKLGYLCSFAEK